MLGLGDPSDGTKKWPSVIDDLTKYIAKNARDPSAKDLVEALKQKYPADVDKDKVTETKLPLLLRALCTVLAPVKAAKGFKPTIPLAQDDVFLLSNNRDEALTELRTQALDSPKLAIIKSDLKDMTGECVIAYKNVYYTCPKISRGIDILVKLRAVLGLPYPAVSKLVWMFIDRFFYGLKPTGSSYMVINKLISFLNPDEQ